MRHGHQVELERLGLSAVEAQIYLALLKKGGTWKAAAVAATMQIPRSTVYLALSSLRDRGLLEAEAGYGGRFSALPAERALPSLVAAEREDLLQREKELLERETVANELALELKSAASPAPIDVGVEMIQVLRDPRSVAKHFQRLQHTARHSIEVFCKAPYFNPGDNKAEHDVLQRGLRARAIYERGGVEDPAIKPYFHEWISAGEEARIYEGSLPHKMVIFDSQIVLMPLFTPGEEMRALLIRNSQLAQSLSLAFQFLWDQSEPLTMSVAKKDSRASDLIPSRKRGGNGQASRSRG
jgi:sugar-specific transcriptional regulator TrmB